jgi:molybdopterin-biosynthesis enzyme MoeA-like protein
MPSRADARVCRQPESSIAPYLTDLQARVKADDVRVGSYPQWGGGVYVSLIARDHARVRALADEVAAALGGQVSEKGRASPPPA